MFLTELTIVGGLNRVPPGPASIWAILNPELKPFVNAVLAPVAVLWRLPGTPGANGVKMVAPVVGLVTMPGATNVFFRGEFVSKLLEMVPEKTSANMPMPPRITVFPSPKGCQANPNRGSQLMF